MEKWYKYDIVGAELGRRIKIAILDTGIDTEHPSIQAAKANRNPFNQVFLNPIQAQKSFFTESTLDTHGHGTQVAATILKIAPRADLYIAKVANGIIGTRSSNFVKVFQIQNQHLLIYESQANRQ
jgi:subtilisin family serine protease